MLVKSVSLLTLSGQLVFNMQGITNIKMVNWSCSHTCFHWKYELKVTGSTGSSSLDCFQNTLGYHMIPNTCRVLLSFSLFVFLAPSFPDNSNTSPATLLGSFHTLLYWILYGKVGNRDNDNILADGQPLVVVLCSLETSPLSVTLDICISVD